MPDPRIRSTVIDDDVSEPLQTLSLHCAHCGQPVTLTMSGFPNTIDSARKRGEDGVPRREVTALPKNHADSLDGSSS